MMIGRYSDSSLSSARCTGAELYAKLASARLYHRGRISVGYYKRRHSAVTIKRCLAVATDPLRVNPLEACVTDPFAEQNPLRRTRQITCSPTVADSYAKTERTTLKRYAKRAEYDKQVVHAILDEAFVCHIGFVADGQPYVIPTGFARDGQTLYFHGSVGSRMLRALESGADICVTVTLLDGLVLARSQFNTDMNYRCVVILGQARPVSDPEEKAAALLKLTEHIIPGRTQHARAASDKELSQTSVLAIDLYEVSAKVRVGNTNDDEEDYAIPVWAGVVPLALTPGQPVPDPRLDPAYAQMPDYIQPYTRPGWTP